MTDVQHLNSKEENNHLLVTGSSPKGIPSYLTDNPTTYVAPAAAITTPTRSRKSNTKSNPETKPRRKRCAAKDQNSCNSPKRVSNGTDSLSNDTPYVSNFSPHTGRQGTSNNSTNNRYSPISESPTTKQTQTDSIDNGVAFNEINYEDTIFHLRREVEDSQKILNDYKQMDEVSRKVLFDLLVKKSRRERVDVRETIARNNIRIGSFRVQRDGFGHLNDQWVDGFAQTDLQRRKNDIDGIRDAVVVEITNLRKKRASKDCKKLVDNNSARDDVFLKPEVPFIHTTEYCDRRDEILRMKKEFIKKEEMDIIAEREKLERERNLHIREIKRVQNEDASRYNNYTILNKNYLPLVLLGKGGFSEVWKAYDLDKCRETACKIHHVNKDWKEGKKANYVRHAMREKDIHKDLDHPNIVKLYDIFTIDNDSFCTVLEYCDGNDLDFYLKQHRTMAEKETRLLIGQVVDALRYLNDRKVPIIHYDLKPANILLQTGVHRFEVKVTDFGLSKTVENSEDNDSIELTSQGAGTYWYLPPETFREAGPSGAAPKISSKVDVWSVGVICYQCIYGKRPFGHEQTQQRILKEGTILKAMHVDFPVKPAVTQLTQDFIRKCLQYDPANRADVMELARHEYARPFTKKVTV